MLGVDLFHHFTVSKDSHENLAQIDRWLELSIPSHHAEAGIGYPKAGHTCNWTDVSAEAPLAVKLCYITYGCLWPRIRKEKHFDQEQKLVYPEGVKSVYKPKKTGPTNKAPISFSSSYKTGTR